jgi:predicted TIM-barrel fold metal-dependent hydrolase
MSATTPSAQGQPGQPKPPPQGQPSQPKPPIINCHTHTFVSGHVPGFLAKTYLPWPFYYLIPLHPIVALFRWWLNGPNTWPFQPWYKKIARAIYKVKETLVRDWVLGVIHYFLGLFVGIQVFYIVYKWATDISKKLCIDYLDSLKTWLNDHHLQYDICQWYWQVLLVLALCLFFPNARNLLIFIFKNLYGFLKSLPGKNTKILIQRYLNLGRFAFHKSQSTNFTQLRGQYPLDTKFVVLPMDMKYMAAGLVPIGLDKQMKGLENIKGNHPKQILPFVAVDPRRIRDKKEPKKYFDWTASTPCGDVELKDCVIKDYIEGEGFSGFKIYPAMGYYPFDPDLLPLWKYAAKKGIPIMTHCIRGPIFYRGLKKPAWDTHPIFTDFSGKELFLPQIKNIDFVVNFTHPLNFLCLLDKSLLTKAVGQSNIEVQKLFGYKKIASTDPDAAPEFTIDCDLSNLKICLGHFGGEDEWQRYLDMDRFNPAACLDKFPFKGIDFFNAQGDDPKGSAPGKIEQVWKFVDWYSIICSLMIQYENVYADISFILHDPGILPLLKKTLNFPNTRLRERVLYGTDFYVVRNYKSDRDMLAELFAGLDEDEFDQIARYNPKKFLS